MGQTKEVKASKPKAKAAAKADTKTKKAVAKATKSKFFKSDLFDKTFLCVVIDISV